MHQPRFLLSTAARTLSLREVLAMSDDQPFALFGEDRVDRRLTEHRNPDRLCIPVMRDLSEGRCRPAHVRQAQPDLLT
jgi:hypothetical protein